MIRHGNSGESELVKIRVDGASATVLLNRADKRNAITQQMLNDVQQALDDLHQEKRVRAVILTGVGDTFSAGTDLYELREVMTTSSDQPNWFEYTMMQKDLIEKMLRFPKPLIAAVNGPSLGFGAALVLACDFAIGCELTCMGFPEPTKGLVAGMAAPLLAFRLGGAAAADLLLRSDTIDSAECQNLGIVSTLVSTDLIWAKADSIAREMAGQDPISLSMTKRLLNETIGEQLFTQLAAGAAATASARTTEAAEEGIRAFCEKREPNWL